MNKILVSMALGGAALCSSALAADPMDIGLVEEVVIVSRTIPAINFRKPGTAGTHLDWTPSALVSDVRGELDVDAKQGYVQVHATAWNLPPAATFGDEYMTYVMWAITPEGRPTNLGELLVDDKDKRARLEVTSELQSFGMIVTAEPHFAVTMPSDVVVMEATPRPGTDGKMEAVDAKFELLKRGHYAFRGNSRTDLDAPSAPFYVIQARNARRLAADAQASTHAADSFAKGQALLVQAEGDGKAGERLAMAKQAAQTFEDARLTAEEKLRVDRMAAAEASAETERLRANMAQEQVVDAEAEADAARRAAMESERARMEAEAGRLKAEQEKAALRENLRQQFLALFETRESNRGLILSMSNVLFDFNRDTLRSEAREKLARLAGIVIATPGLRLEVEGHADAIGSDEYNQALSVRRAESVRSFLVGNSVDASTIVARGFGESQPLADNGTEAGRQQNRRVEIVVSGGVIGVASQQP